MKRTVSTILITLISSLLLAQNESLKTYEGPFREGTAKYTYFENEKGERVYQGKFEYIEKATNFSVKNIFGEVVKQSASIKQTIGQYKNGKPIGERKKRMYLIAAEGNINLSKINTTNSQLIEEISYNFDEDGKLIGNYLYTSYDVNTNKINKKIVASIKDNHLIGKYELIDYRYNPIHNLKGEFNKDGYFNGDWTYVNSDVDISTIEKLKLKSNAILKESRKYNNGILLSKKLYDNSMGNLLYEYNGLTDFSKENYPNVTYDSLKLNFKNYNKNTNMTNIIDKLNEGNYLKYKDYTNLHSRDLLPSGMMFSTEFEDIGGFVKVYTYRYNLDSIERKNYKKRSECYGLIDVLKEKQKTKHFHGEHGEEIWNESKFLDSLYFYCTKHFLNLFDNKQKAIEGQFQNNRICYVFNDTLASDPKIFKEIPKQIEENQKIKKYYYDLYIAAYKKIAEGYKIENALIKSAQNIPYQNRDNSVSFKDYASKRDSIISKLIIDFYNIRKTLYLAIKKENNNEFLNLLDKSIEELNKLNTNFESDIIELIKSFHFTYEEQYINEVKKAMTYEKK